MELQIFTWDSQIGKGLNSSYMQDVLGAARNHGRTGYGNKGLEN